ncbi:MAG: hypothetical protein [Caudoviricetes sp.]|nr:MAG: hypothetical protein [Caudoviricetes sp.]
MQLLDKYIKYYQFTFFGTDLARVAGANIISLYPTPTRTMLTGLRRRGWTRIELNPGVLITQSASCPTNGYYIQRSRRQPVSSPARSNTIRC